MELNRICKIIIKLVQYSTMLENQCHYFPYASLQLVVETVAKWGANPGKPRIQWSHIIVYITAHKLFC